MTRHGPQSNRLLNPRRFPRILVGLLLILGSSISLLGCRGREAPSPERPAAETPSETGATSSTQQPDEWQHDTSHGTRTAALAGAWYSDDPEQLQESIEEYLSAVDARPGYVPGALVVPHAGHGYSGQTAAYGYASIRDRATRRVFIMAPSHRVYFAGAAVPSVSFFETPLGRVPVDTGVTYSLADHAEIAMDDRAHETEHSIEIQLPFLQVVLPEGFRLVPVAIGELDAGGAERLAAALRPFVGPGDLVLASSDFTHYGESYGYVPFREDVQAQIRALDMGAFEAIQTVSAAGLEGYRGQTGITVCGYRAIMTLLALLPAETTLELLDYDTSGRQTNDWERSVSYLTIAADLTDWPAPVEEGVSSVEGVEVLDHAEQREALRLARTVLEQYLRERHTPTTGELGIDTSGPLGEPYGVFVTLNRDGRLRGCIGNIWPEEPLAEAIIGRTIDAAVHDRRFRPVTADELDVIDIEISVLTVPTFVASHDDIEIGRHGIVLQKQRRRAVYLPQVAPDQGWDLEQTLGHLSEKAGLTADAWRSGTQFEVFEAQVFEEEQH